MGRGCSFLIVRIGAVAIVTVRRVRGEIRAACLEDPANRRAQANARQNDRSEWVTLISELIAAARGAFRCARRSIAETEEARDSLSRCIGNNGRASIVVAPPFLRPPPLRKLPSEPMERTGKIDLPANSTREMAREPSAGQRLEASHSVCAKCPPNGGVQTSLGPRNGAAKE